MSLFEVLDLLTIAFEAAGVVILVVGGSVAFAQWVVRAFRTLLKSDHSAERAVRTELSHRILLALEFLIVADIIQSVKDPSLEDLARLGVTVLIRTILHYSLRDD